MHVVALCKRLTSNGEISSVAVPIFRLLLKIAERLISRSRLTQFFRRIRASVSTHTPTPNPSLIRELENKSSAVLRLCDKRNRPMCACWGAGSACFLQGQALAVHTAANTRSHTGAYGDATSRANSLQQTLVHYDSHERSCTQKCGRIEFASNGVR